MKVHSEFYRPDVTLLLSPSLSWHRIDTVIVLSSAPNVIVPMSRRHPASRYCRHSDVHLNVAIPLLSRSFSRSLVILRHVRHRIPWSWCGRRSSGHTVIYGITSLQTNGPRIRIANNFRWLFRETYCITDVSSLSSFLFFHSSLIFFKINKVVNIKIIGQFKFQRYKTSYLLLNKYKYIIKCMPHSE